MIDPGTTIVIVGATGDLTRRKLLPALFNLRCKGRLPEDARIVGFARSLESDDQFREYMWKGVGEFGDLRVQEDRWEAFARNLFFVQGSLSNVDDFVKLRSRLDE